LFYFSDNVGIEEGGKESELSNANSDSQSKQDSDSQSEQDSDSRDKNKQKKESNGGNMVEECGTNESNTTDTVKGTVKGTFLN